MLKSSKKFGPIFFFTPLFFLIFLIPMNNTDLSFCDSCTNKCAFISYDNTYHCVSEEIYYFCYDGIPNFFALAAALIAFNLIIYALALIKGGYHSHIYFLIHSFLQNIAIAIAITGIICMKGISYEVWHLIVIIVGFLYSSNQF